MKPRIPLVHSQVYHLYNYGINRMNIFYEARNYPYFLRLLRRHTSPIADLLAYCLLPNHFHLLVRIKEWQELPQEIQTGKIKLHHPFSHCFNAYSKSINNAYNRSGKLLNENVKRQLVDTEEYLKRALYYIHANPQKHGLVRDFREYQYSSYQLFESGDGTWLDRESVISLLGSREAFLQYHADYHSFLEEMNEE
ncbi:MAG: transposase [Bacteroidota bacterium]